MKDVLHPLLAAGGQEYCRGRGASAGRLGLIGRKGRSAGDSGPITAYPAITSWSIDWMAKAGLVPKGVQRSAEGRVFDCEYVAYLQLRSTFLKTRRITAKIPPTITVNRYASQNIHLSFPCWMPVVASPMSAQPESAHKQENAGQDPAGDAAPE